ncbi:MULTISPECIES: DoxX family protein [Pandoraea]|uniref:DoxX family protein n=1 Tax=Pandoraea TaxID=93217 RepID=UPI0003D223C2|nr:MULTISPECIES: DoxX family protein [Pandoraea]
MSNTQVVKSWSGAAGMVNCVLHWMAKAAGMAAPLFLRVALALPFFKSGLTKWDGFLSLSPAASFLFQEEFKLHILGQVYDLPFPDVLAFASGSGEIIFPILLILGLATRFSALGLLGMTAVIQLIVPEGWANFHLPWATMAIALIAIGPGRLSLDHWIRGYFGLRTTSN